MKIAVPGVLSAVLLFGAAAGKADQIQATPQFRANGARGSAATVTLTPTRELSAFLRWVTSRYPYPRGYWTCPQAQIVDGTGICIAEITVGTRIHQLRAVAMVQRGAIVLRYKSDTAWVRRWSPFRHRVIAGLGASGTASVNSPAYDWGWLAGQVHFKWQHHHSRFSAVAYDGPSLGLRHLYRFRCVTHRHTIRCTNALGDSMRYRPRG
jgi:hypothetical protein